MVLDDHSSLSLQLRGDQRYESAEADRNEWTVLHGWKPGFAQAPRVGIQAIMNSYKHTDSREMANSKKRFDDASAVRSVVRLSSLKMIKQPQLSRLLMFRMT